MPTDVDADESSTEQSSCPSTSSSANNLNVEDSLIKLASNVVVSYCVNPGNFIKAIKKRNPERGGPNCKKLTFAFFFFLICSSLRSLKLYFMVSSLPSRLFPLINSISFLLFFIIFGSKTNLLNLANFFTFWILQVISVSVSAVAFSTVHLMSVKGKERDNSKVISSVISWSNVPVSLIFPFFLHLSTLMLLIVNVGGVIFVLFLLSSLDKS